MERVLLISLGSRGDMEPFLAMGEELQVAGHSVAFCMPLQFQSLAMEVSQTFYAMDKRFLELVENEDVKNIIAQVGSAWTRLRTMVRLMWETKPLQQQLVRDQHAAVDHFRPDLIIFHGKCIYPILAALEYGQRVKMLCPVPCMIHAVDTEPNIGFGDPGSVWWNRLTYFLANKLYISKSILGYGGPVAKDELQFRNLDSSRLTAFMLEEMPVEYAISERLFPRPGSWPPHAVITGFRERDKAKHWTPPAPLLKFLSDYPEPLYAGFGSMVNEDPEKVGQIILDVTAELELPVLLNTGWGGGIRVSEEDLPRHAFVVNDIPYDWLFSRVCAVVHHGGSGTTHSALRFDKPQLIVPHISDQFLWMRLVNRAGFGPMGFPIKSFSKETFKASLTADSEFVLYTQGIVKIGQSLEFLLPSGAELRSVSSDLEAATLRRPPVVQAQNLQHQKRIDCGILERLNQTCGSRPGNLSALSREWQAVRLKPCAAGERRSSYTGTDCVQCVPGRYKSGVGPALTCSACGIGFYMGLPGAGACTICPEHETTNITGATSISSCDCVPGYFRTNPDADWELVSNHGVCRPCPDGAICEGGAIQPYASGGYWTPDRLVFWPCFPSHACLEGDAVNPNRCEDARDPTSVRCGQCHTDAFAHQSECYSCSGGDVALAWAGPFLGLLVLVCGFTPALIRSLWSMDMEHTKLQHRLLATTQKHSSWLGRLAESDHGEFRMVIVMLTSLQTLWTVSLMPLPYTRFTKDWLWITGIVACDVSILRPQCALKLSYFMKWLMQWATFFVVVAVLALAMLAYCFHHKNRLKDLGYISPKRGILGVFSITLMLLLLVHLRDDLIFLSCVTCEGDKMCLAFQPVIECSTNSWEWSTMMVLSILDLIFVVAASLPLIAICIYSSWKWQHGHRRGLDATFSAPWYVYFSEFWVKRHRGYIQEVREAVPEFQKLFLEEEVLAASHKEVWHRAIDLILAQEAEKADALLLKVIEHMYTHSDRFRAIDEDEGPAFQIIRNIRSAIKGRVDRPDRSRAPFLSEGLMSAGSASRSEATIDQPVPPETEPDVLQVATFGLDSEEPALREAVSDDPLEVVEKLKVSDVHHVKLTLENVLDYARWSVPGARAIKRVLSYSWTLILLIARFVITIYAMLMRRDQSDVPLVYLLVTLAYVLLGAGLQPYVWGFLNDWEVAVHSLIYVFLLFVISGWSDTASDVLVVVATMSAVVPVVLRFLLLLCGQDKQDPDDNDTVVSQGSATYNLNRLALSQSGGDGGVSRAASSVGPKASSRSRSVQDAGRHREHVRNYIEMVKNQSITVVQSADEPGQEMPPATSTEADAAGPGVSSTDGQDVASGADAVTASDRGRLDDDEQIRSFSI
ncbi:UGT80B1 [Symbiodinium microadriaticum]|nr:UGT80B1 [Symbiodinium microadriaticum]